jgi:hypothetical protein
MIVLLYLTIYAKMSWASFWATFSKTHPVTLVATVVLQENRSDPSLVYPIIHCGPMKPGNAAAHQFGLEAGQRWQHQQRRPYFRNDPFPVSAAPVFYPDVGVVPDDRLRRGSFSNNSER